MKTSLLCLALAITTAALAMPHWMRAEAQRQDRECRRNLETIGAALVGGRVADAGGLLLAHAVLAEGFVHAVVFDAGSVFLGHIAMLAKAPFHLQSRTYPSTQV